MTLNFAFYLSLVLAAFGCTGLILAGTGKWYGWGIGLAVQPVWATYAIVTHGYGLILTSLMYGFVNARNLLRWYREEHKEVEFNYNQTLYGVFPVDDVQIDEWSSDPSMGLPRKTKWWQV